MKHILIFKPHKDSLNIMDITVMGNMYANIISTLKMGLVIIFVSPPSQKKIKNTE